MFDLPGHDGTMHALTFESLDQFGQFSQREPVNCRRSVRFDVRERFFFNGCNHNVKSLGAGGVEHEKRKATVTRDQSNSFPGGGHGGQCTGFSTWHLAFSQTPLVLGAKRYLITPRSEDSMNRISISTSSPLSGSAFNIFSA